MTLRVAIVGVGGVGGVHVELASTLPAYELVAVCDVRQEVAQQVADEFGVKAYVSPLELFSAQVADAVVVATPPFTHTELATAALDAGLHLYCEKPIARTFAEGQAIHRAAVQNDRRVQVGFQHRFQPSYTEMKRRVERGEIGDIFRANLVGTDWFRGNYYFTSAPWRSKWATAGGGILMSQVIHDLDVLLWMVGMPSLVHGRAWHIRHDIEVEDEVVAILEFPNGGSGVVLASNNDAIGRTSLELHGETGSLVAERDALRFAALPESVQHMSDHAETAFPDFEFGWENIPVQQAEYLEMVRQCHEDFIAAIEHSHVPLNNAAEASRAVEVANAIYLSACTGKDVRFPVRADEYADVFDRLSRGELVLPTRGR